ncbi:acyl-CoA dehydrogenase family protein [Ramlibacter solisilvae]|uniref:Acyl-CoA dehydrogenase n=1 Tax=Ramlibacter tataouinensis TaxID=94132 RepID=A0A127JUS9_9BURK|nr:acyl-CoA dehydrogenase family protein [Ramlibacter tataouinensis]AMO21772.1 acyl-CoA dehydrogenase [Ramlibacter tataouinensis]
MFAEAIEDILRDRCTPAVVRAIEQGGDPLPLWRALSDAGFLDLLRPEEEGGAGLPLPELYPVVAQFGRYAAPLPLAQAIGARALVGPGVALPDGPLTLAPALRRRSDGSLHAPLVPFGAIAQHVLAADGDRLVLLSCAEVRRIATGIPNSQAATLVWADDRGLERLAGDAAALSPLAAALQAALLAGGMTRVFEMTLQYCNERSQFGRTLGKFQAIQHQLAVMAELVAASGIAAEAAFQAPGRVPRLLPAAMAKARASEAAPDVANTAHALHGAIGVTEEYDLQLFTRRLHEGRTAHGSESYWNHIVGEQVLASSGTLAEFVRAA